jgi:hypothetical protein
VAEDHDRILQARRTLIDDLAREVVETAPADLPDLLLALADTQSELGRWIRGDEPSRECLSIASFLFIAGDAKVFLGSVPSRPGLVVLVVDHTNLGVLYRFISGVAET